MPRRAALREIMEAGDEATLDNLIGHVG